MWNAFKRWLESRRQQVVVETEVETTQEVQVNGFSFRMMTADFEDIDDLVALEQTVYGESLAWTGDIFRDDLQNKPERQYIILRQPETNSLVGYIGLEVLPDANQVHITSVTIAPHWQGRAVGTFLMTYIMLWAQREAFAEAYLEVRASDEDAQRFYGRLGFEQTDVLADYYDIGEDAYVMHHALDRYQGDFG
ncbi:GNAT family N-acetyltransferase [Weissella ceti]|uniref:GNAT family N-acetyltransferase n=1 Tax=Weissella ceti TaxID=759620 RepID=A0ABT3E4J6_9LACO|nr:GNAT family N-acetyltransferase [Weissella ceti]MCW0953330.1 GNAT family N-acetyltransferase [Weissella ceti]QVK11935.1 GNAT family N-acetyltransferase [Weissella ceti]